MTENGQIIESESAPTPPSGPGAVNGGLDPGRIALIILTVLAVLYTLRFASPFFLPIVLAILLNLLLSPLVRLLRNHLRMPNPLGAGVVLLLLLTVVTFGAYSLTPSASAWLARAPESLATLQRRIQPLRQPMEKVNKAAEEVEQATDLDKKTPGGGDQGPQPGPTALRRYHGAPEHRDGGDFSRLLPLGIR